MDDRHFSDDELLHRLYGIGERADHDLERCVTCSARWNSLCEARAAELSRMQAEKDESFFSQQRRAVLSQIESKARRSWLPGPVPAFATAMVCLIATLLYQPAPQPVEISDAQFFAEVYSAAEWNEPRAAAPIENLFQGEQAQ
jgi:hypothetical protein